MKHVCLFHGLSLAVTAEATVLQAVQARLSQFPLHTAAGEADLRFEYLPVSAASQHVVQRPPGPGRVVLELQQAEVSYFEESRQLYVEATDWVRALCDVEAGRVTVSYVDSVVDAAWFLSHPLFTIPLQEVLKHRGLYMVHAAMLAEQGQGVLVAGASGAGKTTLALALIRAGFDFLGDDLAFLSRRDGEWAALAFPDEIDITAQTAGFFPELGSLLAAPGPKLMDRPKRSICASQIYGCRPIWQCTPRVVVFPQRSSEARSVLAPLTKPDALLQLLTNVLRTNVQTSQTHLDALAELVRKCACYQFAAGRDFDSMPALVRSTLKVREGVI